MYDDVAGLPPFRRGLAPPWLTEARIRRAIRDGDLVVSRRGVLTGRRRLEWPPDDRDRHLRAAQSAIASLRGGSPAYACLGTAAMVHRINRLGRRSCQRVRLYRERGGPWRDAEVAVLVCGLPAEHVTVCDGVPTTTQARTAIDLARWVVFRSGVVVVDSALRNGCTRAELEAVTLRCARWPGIRRAREVVAFADGRAASPLESISRVAFAEMGLPEPELQVPIGNPERPTGIVDFYWDEFGVIGEADGLLKYDDEDPEKRSLRAEKLRQEALEALGYIVVRWTWDDIWRRPTWVRMRLERAFREGARRCTG